MAGRDRDPRPRPARVQLGQAPGAWSSSCPTRPSPIEYGDPSPASGMWWSDKGDDLSNTMTRRRRPHGVDHRGPRPEGALRHRGRTSTTCTCRRRRTARRGPAWTARSAASRSSVTAATARPSRVVGGRVGRRARRPRRLRRRAGRSCGSSTAPTVAWPPTGSSPTRSSSPPMAPRCVTQRRRGRRRGLDARRVHGRRPAPRPAIFDNYYIASHRSFVSYDKYLKTGPYNFGFANTKPDLGGALQLHAGTAHLVLGHVTDRQQHERAPRAGADPADRLAPARRSSTSPAPRGGRGSRCTTRPSHCTKAPSFTLHVNGSPSYIRGQDAPAGVRRQPRVPRPGPAGRRGRRPRHEHPHPRAVRQAARRCGSASASASAADSPVQRPGSGPGAASAPRGYASSTRSR